jgi:cytochrome P450
MVNRPARLWINRAARLLQPERVMRGPVDNPFGTRPRGLDREYVLGWLRALMNRTRLPPGRMQPPLDQVEQNDRLALFDLARRHGPIFKGTAWGGALWIYVFGLERGRKLLVDHAERLRPVTIDLLPLFPVGFMRQMEGEDHKFYRARLVRAIKAGGLDDSDPDFAAIFARHLDHFAQAKPDDPAKQFRDCLTDAATDVLLRSLLGVSFGQELHGRVTAAYAALGGSGMVWTIRRKQVQTFETLAALVRDELARLERGEPHRTSVLSLLAAQGPLDATMIGNIIYMIEMGRHDLAGFLRWIAWFAARNPAIADEIAAAPSGSALPEAFVQETLRLEQSERLVRTVTGDFTFEGLFFPKGANVRVCVWEAHKDASLFDEPFAFDPRRFLSAAPEHYAPFGLDRHQCPFASYSLRVGGAFLRAMLARYRVDCGDAGPAVRGQYHWEPATRFAPRFEPRDAMPEAAP